MSSPTRHLGSRRARATAALGAAALALGTAATAVSPATAAGPDHSHRLSSSRPDLSGADLAGSQRLGAVPDSGRYAFLLQLDVASTQTAFARERRTSTRQDAKRAARQQLSRVTAAQNAVIGDLPSRTPVLYRTHAALPAVAVTTDVHNFAALASIHGVKAVYPIAPKTHENSYAVPLQGAPAAWEGNGDLGENTKVGIIDTGIDYTHANFGGPGTVDAYDTEHEHADDPTLWSGSIFPTGKVVGGYDLVGDDYNADPTSDSYNPNPVEDPNPLDCDGHGSHVAGSAAGYGENADGTTYTGTYDESTDFASMRIGPGMAPQASLYAFRVFGCEGSTDVVGAAIDRAMDPNGDGDPSDAMDVVNMSLGSDFGSPDDGDAVMVDAATDAGVTMSISSGNSYDLYDVGGSPGSAQKAITVAAAVDAQSIVDGLDVQFDGSDAPDTPYAAERSVAYNWADDPDLAGEVVAPTDNTTGCTPFTGADAAAISGKIALLTWTDDNLECGSVTRSGNVVDAGGIGFVFASNLDTFSAGITGSAVIPGVLVNHAGGQAIRDALTGGQTVTVTGTEPNAVKQTFPADDDKVTDFSSRGIRVAGNVKPDVSAVGATVFSTAVGTGDDGVNESGTSMAAPMVAGLAALVVSQHPDWTPEQVKADIMNTAGQNLYTGDDHTGDRYAPNRVGAGRIQADRALANDVLAYVTEDPGAVSVSFGPLAVTEPVTLSKHVKVQNTGDASQTYNTSYDAITSVPGVDYSVSPASVTVPAGGEQTVTVTLTIADPSALTKTVDPTHGRTDQDGLDLQTLADASGNLLLTPDSGEAPQLRVPVYSAPRPASSMSQANNLSLSRAHGDSAKLALSGTGVDQGADEENVFSIVSGFELQAKSGVLPACSDDPSDSGCASTLSDKAADLKYVGYTSDAPYSDPGNAMAYFALASQGAHGTAAGQAEYDIYLDTDRDGTPDLVAYNGRFPDEDLMVTILIDLTSGDVVDAEYTNVLPGSVDTATYDSDVIVMPVWLTALADYGVDADHPRIDYAIQTFSYSRNGEVDEAGWDGDNVSGDLSADLFTPGLTVVDDASPFVMADDQPGNKLTVTRNPASYAADGGKGLMMVHFHNAIGSKAQLVHLATKKLDGSVSLRAPHKVRSGHKATLAAKVVKRAGLMPTGEVTFRSTSGKKLGSAKLRHGTARIRVTVHGHGVLKVRAFYGGDENYTSATSRTRTIHIKR